MKMLFIGSQTADYVQDLAYSGLVKRLGLANVIDRPWNRKFHIPYKAYPKNLGYTPHSLLPSLLRRADLRRFDAVVVAAAKVDAFHAYRQLLDQIPAAVPILFIDGGDQPELGGGLAFEGEPTLYQEVVNRRPFDLIFKREYRISDAWGSSVHPFPISFNLDRLPSLAATQHYQVSFWAVESDPIRTQALQLLEDQFDCRANGTVRSQKFSQYRRKGAFYLQELSACHIVLNFRGGGWDTLRYWEVPAVGRLQISQRPAIQIPNNFVADESIVYIADDLSDLLDKCRFYLAHETVRESIAAAGQRHLHQYHTDVARADQLLQQLQALPKNRPR